MNRVEVWEPGAWPSEEGALACGGGRRGGRRGCCRASALVDVGEVEEEGEDARAAERLQLLGDPVVVEAVVLARVVPAPGGGACSRAQRGRPFSPAASAESTTSLRRLCDASATPLQRLGYLSAISRLSLGYLSAISRLSLGYLSAISRLALGYLSAISRLSLGYLSASSRLSSCMCSALFCGSPTMSMMRSMTRSCTWRGGEEERRGGGGPLSRGGARLCLGEGLSVGPGGCSSPGAGTRRCTRFGSGRARPAARRARPCLASPLRWWTA